MSEKTNAPAATKTIRAYHFTADRLRDGSPIPPVGEWLKHDGPVVLCESGLHASVHPFDALRYAPGNLLHLVELRGTVVKGDDKLAASERRIVATIDAEHLLRSFARECALDVYDEWGNEKTDPDGVCLRYLKTGDESLRAAAGGAARGAARAAAGAAAAWDAARYAAWDAAWDAAGDAAWNAAGAAAAWDAAWNAAGDAAGDAAWNAAGDAAWNAARAAQRRRFARMVGKAFKEIL